MHILNLILIIPSKAIELFIVFDFEHFNLITFLFLELIHRLLFNCCFLDQFVLICTFLVL